MLEKPGVRVIVRTICRSRCRPGIPLSFTLRQSSLPEQPARGLGRTAAAGVYKPIDSDRQINPKVGPFAGLTAGRNQPFVIERHPLTDRQPDTRTGIMVLPV